MAAIPGQRMADGSWEHMAPRRFATSAGGYRELVEWLALSGLGQDQIKIGIEPTGGWYTRTVSPCARQQQLTTSSERLMDLRGRRRLFPFLGPRPLPLMWRAGLVQHAWSSCEQIIGAPHATPH